jgi:hypothetical protein
VSTLLFPWQDCVTGGCGGTLDQQQQTMKTKLITALRTCAKALENNTFAYDWTQPQSCNCGIVACALMGKSISEMREILKPMRLYVKNPNWNVLVASFCPVTGIPENAVFKTLAEAGMSQTDIIELESLSNKQVLKRTKMVDTYTTETIQPSAIERFFGKKQRMVKKKVHYCANKDNAIRYMRVWADILTEEGAEDTVTSTEPKAANQS